MHARRDTAPAPAEKRRTPASIALRCALLAGLLASLIGLLGAAPAAAAAGCAGDGAGLRLLSAGGDDEESGIGGTGHAPEHPPANPQHRSDPDDGESGIGGTGILGRVSGLDPLCVNGFALALPTAAGGPTDNALTLDHSPSVGERVFVEARQSDAGWLALRIVSASGEGEGAVRQAFLAWLERAREGERVSIEGRLGGSARQLRIEGLRLRFRDGGSSAESARPGDPVRVEGRLDGRGGLWIEPRPAPDTPRPERPHPSAPPDGSTPGPSERIDEARPVAPDRSRPDRPARPVRPPRPVAPERPTSHDVRELPSRPMLDRR